MALALSLLNPFISWSAIREMTRILYRQRELTWEMAKREFVDRYAGQILGFFWGIAHPLIVALVYVFIFGVVFKVASVRSNNDLAGDYIVYLLAGLVPWLAFQEVLNKGTLAIVGNSNLVKQVIFPVEVLPAKGVISAILTELIFLGALMAYILVRQQTLPWTIVLLPLLLAIQAAGMLGFSLLLSALGAYFRDLKEVIQVFCLLNVYLMPVVYLPGWVPAPVRPFIALNPFSYMTWCFQDVFFNGAITNPWVWLVYAVTNVMALVLGYRVFRKLKNYFGNVL